MIGIGLMVLGIGALFILGWIALKLNETTGCLRIITDLLKQG